MKLGFKTSLIAATTLLVLSSPASAATTLGQAPPSAGTPQGSCTATVGTQVSVSSGNSYVAPSNGVITSWATSLSGMVALNTFRGSETTYTRTAASSYQTVSGTLTSFDVRIPVLAGDRIGVDLPGNTEGCGYNTGSAGDVIASNPSPLAIGQPDNSYVLGSNFRWNISAVLEADDDGDGYGDETQDQCPTDASRQTACPVTPDTDPPETTITRHPPNKSEKERAKFGFNSDEAGSTFECKLKGDGLKPALKQFKACESPRKYKNLDPGKYVFKVRATDEAGNTDPTPAEDTFKLLD